MVRKIGQSEEIEETEDMDEESFLHMLEIAFGKFPDGRKKMVVKFANGASWVPRWEKDVLKIYDKGLYVEKFNRRHFGKGRPKTHLVDPVIRILRSRGYMGGSLFCFALLAGPKSGPYEFGDTISVPSDNLEQARKKAVKAFEDRISAMKRDDPDFADVPWEVKKITWTEYIRKGSSRTEIPEGEYF